MSKVGKAQQEMLPKVFSVTEDLPAERLLMLTAEARRAHPLPQNLEEWNTYRTDLRQRILTESRAHIQHDLPLELWETKKQQLQGYTVRNIRFQTQKGLYATASLYVPDGTGKFPAVITTHGHWPDGRRNEIFQSVAHTLATNGYVCLVMDAWGAGERTTVHGENEYHGSNLGASLLDVGETLLGLQLTDNIRGIDLLQSLAYVDAEKIGATGASGGGNQAMWLAAVDERVQAVVPVVSVGTFESYIMNSNCVCELLPNGLTFTEEDGVLALIAPRALKIFSAQQDTNPSFQPAQMLKSYQQAVGIYAQYQMADKCSYQLFNSGHGYWPEMRSAMLGWFNRWLKHTSSDAPVKEQAFELLPSESLLTYVKGQREKEVRTTAAFCYATGARIYQELLHGGSFNRVEHIIRLKKLIGLEEENGIAKVHLYDAIGEWERYGIETTNGKQIPVLLKEPKAPVKGYRLFIHEQQKDSIPPDNITEALHAGYGVVLLDVWGTGEQRSAQAEKIDGSLPPFHTLSRSLLWLGKTVMGEWIDDIGIVGHWLREEKHSQLSSIVAFRETGVAALIYGALEPSLKEIITFNTPYSYRFDDRNGVDFYSMAIHIPGILPWGDIATLVALNHAAVEMVDVRTMSGHLIEKHSLEQIRKDYAIIQQQVKGKSLVVFPLLEGSRVR